jgi:hypothetical protein
MRRTFPEALDAASGNQTNCLCSLKSALPQYRREWLNSVYEIESSAAMRDQRAATGVQCRAARDSGPTHGEGIGSSQSRARQQRQRVIADADGRYVRASCHAR